MKILKQSNPNSPLFLSLFSLLLISLRSISSTDLLFNGFSHSNLSLYGIAQIDTHTKALSLTNRTNFAIGRALYPTKIPAKDPKTSKALPFSTSFIFSMAPFKNTLPGHGIVFLFVPYTGIQSANSAQNLGFLNRTNTGNSSNHIFGIEFDVFKNEEFGDISANHIGIDVNSLTSSASHDAGYYTNDGSFNELKLNNGKNYQVWIDYDDFVINVTMVIAGVERPKMPLLSFPINLSSVFENDMYVGFTASTGQLVENHWILGWSFSNSNFSLSKALVTTGLPNFELPKDSIFHSKGFIAGLTLGVFFFVVGCVVLGLFWVRRVRRLKRERDEMEDWEFEYWPHRMSYQEIETATNGFSDENVIGIGGNGKVYKGVMQGGADVAVKRISHESSEGMREFLAEISSIGRLKHRNLVGLRGWCKQEKGTFILVYDYMENGSLDRRIYDCDDDEKMLSYEDRIKVLKDVASGVLYLHEGWESKVLHRDIKASNVLLDKEMNAKLGDFGLARMHDHGQVASTTRVVGTVGYMAPEVVRTGRASEKTDVFGFGVLILEVICGRRPIEEGKPPLVEWVWELMAKGELGHALDEKLRAMGGVNEEEVEKLLHLGLLCSYPDPASRPTMRQVAKILEGRVDGDDSETEDMEMNLLDHARSKDMWSRYTDSFQRHGSHPTFEQMRNSISSSMSLTWSDTVVAGRKHKSLLGLIASSFVPKQTQARRESPTTPYSI